LYEKGINEFYNASKIVSKLSDDYIFIHLGSESHQSRMDKASLEKKAKENSLYFLGYKSNIQDYMTASDVVVLPSYYREGVPRSLLEALALDKYILTTNRPGCKEVVINDWNGKLFEAKNHKDLASKVLSLSFETLQSSNSNSRKFAENFFDSKIIVEMTLSEYGLMN
jgi:N,N'-diacetylbacillosaminyl-diphospho-undecaprenol alpha-1,3-N-acetylgalactosaminyltransferase